MPLLGAVVEGCLEAPPADIEIWFAVLVHDAADGFRLACDRRERLLHAGLARRADGGAARVLRGERERRHVGEAAPGRRVDVAVPPRGLPGGVVESGRGPVVRRVRGTQPFHRGVDRVVLPVGVFEGDGEAHAAHAGEVLPLHGEHVASGFRERGREVHGRFHHFRRGVDFPAVHVDEAPVVDPPARGCSHEPFARGEGVAVEACLADSRPKRFVRADPRDGAGRCLVRELVVGRRREHETGRSDETASWYEGTLECHFLSFSSERDV